MTALLMRRNGLLRAAAVRTIGLVLALAVALQGQVADQIIVYSIDPETGDPWVHRYDRQLKLLGTTNLIGVADSLNNGTDIAVGKSGTYSVCIDPLNYESLVRLDSIGQLLPSVALSHNPVAVAISQDETAYAVTRIPLAPPGPMYAASPTGSLLWSSWAGPQLYQWYADQVLVTSHGEVWIADETPGIPPYFWAVPLFVRIDPANSGAVLETFLGPATGFPNGDTALVYAEAAPDGTMWASIPDYQTGSGYFMVNTDGESVLSQFVANGGYNASNWQLRIGANDDLWVSSFYNVEGGYGSKLLAYETETGTLKANHDLENTIVGFALGASGEDVFAVTGTAVPTLTYFLVRLNAVTGIKSSITLAPPGPSWLVTIANGDPTGFIHANVIDQQGDNDGDGASNRDETLAGSSPFDSSSRPDGPKVYLSFAPTTNAIVLAYVDPDGLFDPLAGLDLSTLSLTVGPYGNVFWFLLPFATALDLSADGTQATLTFGALPLPDNKKWEVEARVSDLTGAAGWDWQVTPPGKL